LVALQAFKQCFEVAFAKALVGFALDEFKEHRAQQGLAEDLQQQALLAVGGGTSIKMPCACNSGTDSA